MAETDTEEANNINNLEDTIQLDTEEEQIEKGYTEHLEDTTQEETEFREAIQLNIEEEHIEKGSTESHEDTTQGEIEYGEAIQLNTEEEHIEKGSTENHEDTTQGETEHGVASEEREDNPESTPEQGTEERPEDAVDATKQDDNGDKQGDGRESQEETVMGSDDVEESKTADETEGSQGDYVDVGGSEIEEGTADVQEDEHDGEDVRKGEGKVREEGIEETDIKVQENAEEGQNEGADEVKSEEGTNREDVTNEQHDKDDTEKEKEMSQNSEKDGTAENGGYVTNNELEDDDKQNFKNKELGDVEDKSRFVTSSMKPFPEQDDSTAALRISGNVSTFKQETETPWRISKTARFSVLNPGSWKEQSLGGPLPPVNTSGQKPMWSPHEWSYKPAPRYIRDAVTGYCAPCQNQHQPNRYAGPCRKKSRETRQWLRHKCMEERDVNLVRPNPPVSVPMRARPWKRRTWLPPPKTGGEEWTIKAERDQAREDHIKAQKLGYETLVGNLVYIDIPGSKDLNRSWKHFLDRNPMAWGFPYSKGTRERPSLPLPSPYLVHQLKESLWKYPKNKFLHSSND